MILAVGLNPVIQRTLFFNRITPGGVNRALEKFITASGKGANVARVLSQLGADYLHITHSGGSQNALFRGLCRKDGLTIHACDTASEIRTCITCIDSEQITEYVEESDRVPESLSEEILSVFTRYITAADTLVISGTAATGYKEDLIPHMTQLAEKYNTRVILDVKGKTLIESLRYSPAVIKPNLIEFVHTFIENNDTASAAEGNISSLLLEKALTKASYISKYYGTTVILTNGAEGFYLVDEDFREHFPAIALKAVNTIGCGDAFTAGLAFRLSAVDRNSDTKKGVSLDEMIDAVQFARECAESNALTKIPGSLCRNPGTLLQ